MDDKLIKNKMIVIKKGRTKKIKPIINISLTIN